MNVFGIAGHSGMGKTTLLERLIPLLTARGRVVSLVKHSHKVIEVDRPGKDSYRLREAGCQEVLLLGEGRWALMHELRGDPELALGDALTRLSACDLVLVEGFKAAPIPKLEVHQADLGKPWLHPDDPHVLAIASDVPPGPSAAGRPWFPLDACDEIATFIAGHARPVPWDD